MQRVTVALCCTGSANEKREIYRRVFLHAPQLSAVKNGGQSVFMVPDCLNIKNITDGIPIESNRHETGKAFSNRSGVAGRCAVQEKNRTHTAPDPPKKDPKKAKQKTGLKVCPSELVRIFCRFKKCTLKTV